MKTFLFIFMAGMTAIFFSYVAGVRFGRQQCHVNVTQQSGLVQSETIKIMRNVNAESLNRGVADIRRILHKKYTIAE